MHPLRRLIRRFDRWLRRCYGVTEFTWEPACLLRIQVARVPHAFRLPDVEISHGAPVLLLHLWNERIPPTPPAGPDLAYALRLRDGLIASLRLVARHIQETPALVDVQAIGGVTAHLAPRGVGGGYNLMRRLGFILLPYHSPLGAFGEFWENFYTWWLIWAYNAPGAKKHPLTKMRRMEFWMSRGRFLKMYGV